MDLNKSKLNDTTVSDEQLVKIFKALSDPTRLDILRIIKNHDYYGECACNVFNDQIDMSQPTMSYHMKMLREAGLITVRKEAREKFVTINHDLLKSFFPNFLELL